MIENGLVSAVLVPMPTPDDRGYVQTLLTDANAVERSEPLAPTLPFHSSNILKSLTRDLEEPVAVVMKSCEVRASVELAKFRQTDLDTIIIVGVDCAGTYDVAEFALLSAEDRKARLIGHRELYRSGTADQIAENPVRPACARCLKPVPEQVDLHISMPVFRDDDVIGLTAGPRFAQAIRDAVPLEWIETDVENGSHSSGALDTVLSGRSASRDKAILDLRDMVRDPEGLTDVLSTCIRCHNCMNVCPICYCKECLFESSVFERRARGLLGLARRKGATRMPADTLVFHLTRMSHMASSCVACGMCESACPSDIPVSGLFTTIGQELQTMFDYQPGRSPEDEPPVKVFREDELQEESGAGLQTAR
jgi:formate dehydrogenase subunit beta